MARSLLRASQLRDEDVLEEIEHDVLVHENLVTSGTLNFQDGTISGTGDVYATTFYGDGSNLSGVSSEPDSLYYSGVPTTRSYVLSGVIQGFEYGDFSSSGATAAIGRIYQNGSGTFIKNDYHNGYLQIQGEDSGGTTSNWLQLKDQGSTLFNDNYATLVMRSGGFYVKDNTGATGSIYYASGSVVFYGDTNETSFIFRAKDTNGDVKNMMVTDPDGAAILYHAGVNVLQTSNTGVEIGKDVAPGATAYLYLGDNDSTNGILYIRGKNTGSISGGQIRLDTAADYDTTIDTYVLQANADDLQIGPFTNQDALKYDGELQRWVLDDDLEFANNTISGTGDVYATTYYGDGSQLTGVSGSGGSDPESLYYNGTDVRATATSAGIEITDGTAPGATIGFSGLDLVIENTDDEFGAGIEFKGHYNGLAVMMTLDPYGGAAIYNGEDKKPVILTDANGLSIRGGTSKSAYFRFHYEGGKTDDVEILNTATSGLIEITGKNSAAATSPIFVGDPDGAAELYHNGIKTIETYQSTILDRGGIILWDATASGSYEISVNGDSNHVYFYNRNKSAGTSFGGLDSGEAWSLGFRFDPDGEAELFYDGVKAVETTDEGIEVIGGVKFPATQNPSSDVNTLDDYDEYTAANTACTGALTVSAIWKLVKVGNLVTLTLPAVNGTTTNVAAITFGVSIPTKYRPTASIAGAAHVWVNGAGLAGLGVVQITTGGVISVYRDGTQSLGWGTAANSGMLTGVSVSWVL